MASQINATYAPVQYQKSTNNRSSVRDGNRHQLHDDNLTAANEKLARERAVLGQLTSTNFAPWTNLTTSIGLLFSAWNSE